MNESLAINKMEHTVIVVGSILQVIKGFMIGLERESLAS